MAKTGLLIVLTIGLLGLFVLCLGSQVAWGFPWELFSHFRVQYFVASVLLGGLIGILFWSRRLRNKPLLIAALLLVGLNTVEVLPWYLPHAQQIALADSLSPLEKGYPSLKLRRSPHLLKVLSANVNIRNDRYEPTLRMIRDVYPDIALVIEINQDWVDHLDAGLKDRLPYKLANVGQGMALWSRLPLQSFQPEEFNRYGPKLGATLQVKGQPIQFVGTHPMVPVRRALFQRRNRDLDKLATDLQKLSEPTIVIGDFNLSPWSPYYRRFIQTTRLHNAKLGFGIFPSYPRPSTLVKLPQWLIPLVNIPIDHCLVSHHFSVAGIRTLDHGNADHAAIVADLVLRPKT